MASGSWESRFARGLRRTVPVILQAEAAECGLACLAMIAAWHGYETDIGSLRRRVPISLKGTTLRQLVDVAGLLHLSSRPLRLELAELADLRVPCILHWDFNHFVVLVKVSRGELTIIDPAVGERMVALGAASAHFTGVALELEPTPSFRAANERTRLSLARLFATVQGLRLTAVHVITLALALETVLLTSPFFLQWVVDGAIVSADRDLLLLLALGFAVLLLVQLAISSARSWIILFASTELSLHLNAGAFAHLLHLPVAWFERRHVGDIVSRFGSLATVQRTVTTSFIESLMDGVMAVATLALMLFYSLALAMVAVASVSLYALLRWTAFRPFRTATEEQIVLAARASSIFMESVRAVTAIKLFNHEDARQARWMNATVDAANRGIATERLLIVYKAAQTLLQGAEHLLIVYLGATAVIDGAFSVGMLLAFLAYKTTFSGRVTALVDKWIQLKMLDLHRDRLADILLEPREPGDLRSRPTQSTAATLEAVGVSFRYGEDEPWVLRNLNLSIRPGECVAITGGSGCGKSTLLKLLMGLLPPTEGEIRLRGIPIARLGTSQYRRSVGAVMQDDQLLAGSILENITFFEPQSDRTRVEACARIAAIHDEIVAMPMGYETLVGDMGSSLSGGQKQRILLARALYKRPELLFLDEATSHLDVHRESLINESIRTLRTTRVLVAHRPHTIAAAERVLVLEGGVIKKDLLVSAAFAESFPRPTGGG
jgi:ATP-binding cassette subfamily B protein RaxB